MKRWLEFLLRIPLTAKVIGAHTLVLAFCGLVAALLGWRPVDPVEMLLIFLATTSALAVTIGLIVTALRPLRLLEVTARRVWEGDYSARVPASPLADQAMSRVAITFNTLLDHLTRDNERMRGLASALIRSGDEERCRAALELHESAAQNIVSISWQLGALARDLSDVDIEQRLLSLKGLSEGVLEDVRRLAESMHPRVLDDLGLAAALNQLARTSASADRNVRVIANVDQALSATIDSTASGALYRVAQEAVWNALQHASPRTVRIRLHRRFAMTILEVVDDGRGFDVVEAERKLHHGLGIFSMRDRLKLVGGDLVVQSSNQGTAVRAYVPCPQVTSEKTA